MIKTACKLIPLLLLLPLFACQPSAPSAAHASLTPAPGSTGNPPLIPHEIAANESGRDCLGCHRDGAGGAPVTPHPQLVDCQQCHIAQQPNVKPFRPGY